MNMKLKKCSFKFIETSLMALLSSTAIASDLPASVSDRYISLGIEHAQSDNINKSSVNKESGYEQSIDLGLGYFNQTATNLTALDYTISYSTYSDDETDDESDISGSLNLSQEIFSKNLMLNLSHFRRSYLLDQSSSDVPENSGDRDVFTINPVWIIPYSKRAGFQLSYNYIATRLSDNDDDDTDRNIFGLAWYHKLNTKTRFELSSDMSDVEYRNTGADYQEISVNASIEGQLVAGTYLVQLGYSKLSDDNSDETGAIFKLAYQYQFAKHNLSLSAERELSDSSLGLGLDVADNESEDFSDSQLLWIDRLQLDHKFIITSRLNNNNNIFYQQEKDINTDEKDPRWGLSTGFDFKNTEKLNSFVSLQYSESTLVSDFDKQITNAIIGAKYLFRPRLSFSLQAEYEKQSAASISSYDEMRYTARIEFRN